MPYNFSSGVFYEDEKNKFGCSARLAPLTKVEKEIV